MVRTVIGGIVGGIVQWLVGFLFWGTPLAKLPFHVAPDAANADLQLALARDLTPTGSGTYHVPWPGTAQGTVLHGQGPVALIHFNTGGFSTMSTSALVAGLVLSILSILLIGVALLPIARRVPEFELRARAGLMIALAVSLYFTLGQPAYSPFLPWGYFVYLAIAQFVGLAAGVLVLARWFLPRA